jgi:hypothetical protein
LIRRGKPGGVQAGDNDKALGGKSETMRNAPVGYCNVRELFLTADEQGQLKVRGSSSVEWEVVGRWRWWLEIVQKGSFLKRHGSCRLGERKPTHLFWCRL